ncbi:MAG: hypothetical protein HYT37_02370 [Candidatus Sungbacteria bacterium]|nr:hypothetical protein [Candidatus Sungbacteria bacterium]
MFCNPRSWNSHYTSRFPDDFDHRASTTPKKRIVPEDIDLESVVKEIVKKERWKTARAKRAEKEYRYFLALIRRHSTAKAVPWNNDLDTFWHYHILDTQKYAADCKALFGYYLHHDPHIKNMAEHKAAVRKTLKLREANNV